MSRRHAIILALWVLVAIAAVVSAIVLWPGYIRWVMQ